MMQITKAFISILNNNNTYPIVTVDNYEDISQYLDKAKYLVVASAGTVIIEPNHLWKKIHSIPDDVGLMGNILQHEHETTPYLHEQFFIINTSAIKNLDFNKEQGKELVRSTEDMHGGWAPLYVTLGDKHSSDYKFASGLIEECLENNFKVTNWDKDWRYPEKRHNYLPEANNYPSRGFVYPTRNTEKFAYGLKNLEIVDGLDDSQELLIGFLKKALEFNVLNFWHFEEPPTYGHLNTVIGPATGFLSEMIALKSNAKKIIFFDINKNNIEFKKHLYANWDGYDYDKFVSEWCAGKNITLEPATELEYEYSTKLGKETKEILFPIWNKWKQNVEFEFLHIDLINEINSILPLANSDTLLYTSTILSIYPFSHMLYEEDKINEVRTLIKETMIYPNSYWSEA